MKSTFKYSWSLLLGIYLLFSCIIPNSLNAQCGTFDVTVNPEPVDGVYYAGTVVEFCVEVTLWEGFFYSTLGVGSQYLHGVQPINIGAGWLPLDSNSGTNDPEECLITDPNGGWRWTNHPMMGWGWFFEDEIPGVIEIDNDPYNNFGDPNPDGAGLQDCQWTFCWQMETTACPPGADGLSLGLTIDLYSDGESGADTAMSCDADPMFNAIPAVLSCCSNPQLDISADALDGLEICSGSDLDLGAEVSLLMTSIPATATNINYFWEGPPSSFWDSTEENPVIPNPVGGEYSVYIDVDGCESIEYEIQVDILGSLNLDWASDNYCANEQSIILEPSPGAETGGTWSGDGVSDMGDGTATFDPSIVGSSSEVSYVLPGSACATPNTQTINILEAPGIPVPEPIDPVCAGETALPMLVAAPDVPDNFVRWYSDPALGVADFIEESNSIQFPSFIDTSTPGQYSVWVQTANSTGCFSDAVEVEINIVDCSCPALLNTFEPIFICNGDLLELEADIVGLDLGTFTWTYPDGSTAEQTNADYVFNVSDPCGDTQELSYELYCTSTDETEAGTIEVTVYPALDDDAVVIAEVEMPDCPLLSVTANCPQYELSLDAGSGPLPGNEYQIPNDEFGSLIITVSQMDALAPCDSYDISYSYSCEIPVVKIPNAFSPNEDGMNDCFQLLGADLSQAEMHIFNRWGEEVFSSTDPLACWNGMQNGEEMEVGVYVYYTLFTYVDGREDSMKGSVTLIR